MTKRRRGPTGPSKIRQTKADQWRRAGEWAALVLRVVVYVVQVAVMVAGNRDGLN